MTPSYVHKESLVMVTQRNTPYSNVFARIGDIFRSVYRFTGRLVLGGLALIAAGIVAIAMTFVGVLIAIAAVVSRLINRPGRSQNARTYGDAPTSAGEGVILEARQTGHGWTVK